MGISELFRAAPNENFEVKRLNRLRLLGTFLAIPPMLWVIAVTQRPAWAPVLTRSIGIVLVASGLALRVWASRSIEGLKKRVLVTWGCYRFLRNPLYAGSLLVAVGACVLAGAPLAAPIAAAAYCALYLPSIRAEERFLAARFGHEWDVYSSGTRALVPTFTAPPLARDVPPLHWSLGTMLQPILLGIAVVVVAEVLRRS